MTVNMKVKLIAFLALALSAGNAARAETVILGEYKGQAKLKVTETDDKQNVTGYENNCTVAYNIDRTATSLAIPFAVFTCEAGMDSWNEKPFSLDIQGTKLLLDGAVVGSLAADGTATFELDGQQTVQVREFRTDANCQPERIETKTYQLAQSLKYVLKPVGAAGYEVSRTLEADTLATQARKEWPNCAAGIVYVPHHVTRTLSAAVSKP